MGILMVSQENGSKEGSADRRAIEIKQLDVAQHRFHEVFSAIRTGAICLTILLSISVICFAVVRICDKPSWLILLLAIFGPNGLVTVLVLFALRQSDKRVRELQEQIKETGSNNDTSKFE